jgi:hypothetical protein
MEGMGVRFMGGMGVIGGISQFAVELLFSHCKKDFHRLLANYLFFLYLLFRFLAVPVPVPIPVPDK